MISLTDKRDIIITKNWDKPVDIMFLRYSIIVNISIKNRGWPEYNETQSVATDWRVLENEA